jgi:hypothetical protein
VSTGWEEILGSGTYLEDVHVDGIARSDRRELAVFRSEKAKPVAPIGRRSRKYIYLSLPLRVRLFRMATANSQPSARL